MKRGKWRRGGTGARKEEGTGRGVVGGGMKRVGNGREKRVLKAFQKIKWLATLLTEFF